MHRGNPRCDEAVLVPIRSMLVKKKNAGVDDGHQGLRCRGYAFDDRWESRPLACTAAIRAGTAKYLVLDLVRAYQIVCFMVGSNEDKFKNLADETKLPEDRQKSCARDYNKAASSWGLALKAHLRAPDQPKTKIDVVYGEGKGNLDGFAQAARSIMLLEPLAQHAADLFVWPAPFTIEMQSCGFINAAWDPSTGCDPK
jgi:hypothetical protein